MKRWISLVLVAIICVGLFAGCGGGGKSSSSSAPAAGSSAAPSEAPSEAPAKTTDFPKRAVNVTCPWAAGGGTDTILRAICLAAEKELGQTITVTNTTGGGGATGFAATMNAEPDGYNLGMITFELNSLPPQGLVPFSYENFDCIMRINMDPAAISVPADAPYDTLEEFIEYAKANPGTLNCGNSGPGSVWHIAAGLVEQTCGVEFKHVPFDGAAPAVTDLAGGHIELVSVSPAEVRGQIEAGTVKMLAVMAEERDPLFPDVPTFKECGYDVVFGTWRGLALPQGVPAEERQILIDAFTKAYEDPDFVTQAQNLGLGLAYQNDADFTAFLADNYAMVEETMKAIGLI